MKKIKNIVFLLEEYFNLRDFERYGINTLIENGFNVEIWDLTAFLAPYEYRMNAKPPDTMEWEGQMVLKSRKEVIKKLSLLDDSYFIISFLHLTYKTLDIYRTIKRMGLPYSVFLFALLLDYTSEGTRNKHMRRFRKIFKQPWRGADFILKKWLERSLPLKPLGIKPADLIIAQADKYIMPNGFPASSDSELLFTHSFDYDLYLKEKDVDVQTDKRLGVFLDEYLPFHSDYEYTGDNNKVRADEYYPKLRDFFDNIESKYGVRIVIAAHPRSHYEDHSDYFGKRRIVRGRTVELVKSSSFVLLHNSTALNYAVLFNKPMIFFTTNAVNKGLIDPPSIECLAGYFNKKAHNLDNGIKLDLDSEMAVDKYLYELYKNDYIKRNNSVELPFWQIVSDRIRQWGSSRSVMELQ